jgi:hypothetical protein
MMGNWRSTLLSSLMLRRGKWEEGLCQLPVLRPISTPKQCLLGNPLVVRLKLVAGETDGLDSTLLELALELSDLSKLAEIPCN